MSKVRILIGVILLLVVATMPIPYASNREFAWAPFAVIVGAIFLTHVYCLVTDVHDHYPVSASLVLAAAAMSVVLVWTALQSMPWFSSGISSVFIVLVPEALGRSLPNPVSVDAEATAQGFVKLAVYCAVFALAADLGRSARYARAATFTVIGATLVVAAYGFVMQATTHSCVALLVVKSPIEASGSCAFSGTFINSGNFATYAGMSCLVCIAHLHWLVLKSNNAQSGTRERWRIHLMVMGREGSAYLAALIILVSALVLSASRAGLLSFILAAVLMITATSVAQGKNAGHVATWTGITIGLALSVLVAADGVVLLRYLDLFDRGDSNRIALFELAIKQIEARPWTGWGLGSFPTLYSIFQPPTVPLVFDKTHNIYLENASDLGIPAALLLTLAVIALAIRCLRGLRERSRDLPYPAIAVGATILIGLQSLVDFGIQMPAVAVTFSTLLGVGWAQSWSSRRSSG